MGKRKDEEDLDDTFSADEDELYEDEEENDYQDEEIYPPDEVLFLGKQFKIIKQYHDVKIVSTKYIKIPGDENFCIERTKCIRKYRLLVVKNTFAKFINDLEPKIKTDANIVHMQGTKLIKALKTCEVQTENEKIKKNCRKLIEELNIQIDAPHMIDKEEFQEVCDAVKKYLQKNLSESGRRIHNI